MYDIKGASAQVNIRVRTHGKRSVSGPVTCPKLIREEQNAHLSSLLYKWNLLQTAIKATLATLISCCSSGDLDLCWFCSNSVSLARFVDISLNLTP